MNQNWLVYEYKKYSVNENGPSILGLFTSIEEAKKCTVFYKKKDSSLGTIEFRSIDIQHKFEPFKDDFDKLKTLKLCMEERECSLKEAIKNFGFDKD